MASNYNHQMMLATMCIIVLLGAPWAGEAALSCGTVDQDLLPCLDYFRTNNANGPVPAPCCNGIKSLNKAAQSTPDRQAVCQCLKQAANALKNVNIKLAASIPPKCGVNIPYKLDPTTDCSTIR